MVNPEPFYNDFIWVIDKIKKEMVYKPDFNTWYEFVIEADKQGPSRHKQYQVLRFLEQFGLFEDFRVKGDIDGKYNVFDEDEPAEVPEVILFQIKEKIFYSKALILLKMLKEKKLGNDNFKITLSDEEIKKEIIGKTNSFSIELDDIEGEVVFDDDTVTLKLKERECKLPPFKNEHFLCRFIFKHLLDEPIQWDLAYEAMGGTANPTKRQKKGVYDSIQRLNKRVANTLGIKEWIRWEDKSFRRTK